MKPLAKYLLSAVAGVAVSAAAEAQTLRLMQNIDAPHFDVQRTTWGPGGSIGNMTQSTLVAMDWDGKTVHPYLAKSWEISPDGRTYTFKLRDDVTFCSGKKFSAQDVVYTFERLVSSETKAPFAWRAGSVKSLRASSIWIISWSSWPGTARSTEAPPGIRPADNWLICTDAPAPPPAPAPPTITLPCAMP